MDQPQSLETLPMPTTPATPVVHQVNLLLLLLQEQGDFLLASTPTGDEEPYDMRETLRSFTRKPESTNCVFCLPHSHTYMSTRKERQAYSLLLQTTMEPLPHGLLVLSSSKPLTGRTGLQTEGRFSLLELHWRHHYSLVYRNTPPDKDSSQDDMPCRTPLH